MSDLWRKLFQRNFWNRKTELETLKCAWYQSLEGSVRLIFINILYQAFFSHYFSPLRGGRWYHLRALGDKTFSSESPWRQRPHSTTAVRQPDTKADGSSRKLGSSAGIIPPTAEKLPWSLSARAERELTLDLLRAPPINQIMTISFFPPGVELSEQSPSPSLTGEQKERNWVKIHKTAQAGFFFPSGKLLAKRIWWENGFLFVPLEKQCQLAKRGGSNYIASRRGTNILAGSEWQSAAKGNIFTSRRIQ